MIVSPSLLSSDFSNLQAELQKLKTAGLAWVHWDVMDGVFVPNITLGPPILSAAREKSDLFFDVHLMVHAPERYIRHFAEAGADLLLIHAEATQHLDRTLNVIKDCGLKAGVALNPASPLCLIQHVLYCIDVVLLMAVNPGFSGQRFIPGSLAKVRALRELLQENSADILLEVDGGVALDNVALLYAAGADIVVSGSAFFGFPPYEQRLIDFKRAVEGIEINPARRDLLHQALQWPRHNKNG